MFREHRLVASFLLGALLSLGIGHAQEEAGVFRSDTTLVELSIIAVDSDGQPVSDLKPEDITIREDGEVCSLAFLRYDGGPQPQSSVPLPSGAFSNRPELAPGPPRNVTAILLDWLNTKPEDQIYARAQVMKFLKELPADTRVAVYLLGNELTVLHDFTDDLDSLRERIAKAETRLALQATDDIATMAIEAQAIVESFTGPSQAAILALQTAQIEMSQKANEQSNERRTRQTLQSIEALGTHLAGIPGRKSIVWISGGIQILSVTSGVGGGIRSYDNWMRDTGRRLATQNVAMYAVDARGSLSTAALDGMDVTRRRAASADTGEIGLFEDHVRVSELSNDPLAAMERLASITGGRAIFHTNDLNRGVRALASDVKGTYSAAFYAIDAPDDKWRDLDVRVARKGVKLQHGKGYLASAPAPTARPWTEPEWDAAISNPLSSTYIPIDARASVSIDGDSKQVNLTVQFDAGALSYRSVDDSPRFAYAELAFVDKSTDAAYALTRKTVKLSYDAEQPDRPYQVQHSWTLMPDATMVRVIVHDQLTGQYGTLELPISQLPLAAAHPAAKR